MHERVALVLKPVLPKHFSPEASEAALVKSVKHCRRDTTGWTADVGVLWAALAGTPASREGSALWALRAREPAIPPQGQQLWNRDTLTEQNQIPKSAYPFPV